MKTARELHERIDKWLSTPRFNVFHKGQDSKTLMGWLVDFEEKIRKDQDKITRHACAEAVIVDYENLGDKEYTTLNKAHNACMNVKAV